MNSLATLAISVAIALPTFAILSALARLGVRA